MSKKGLSDVENAGKVKTQLFKQPHFGCLIKDGIVIPVCRRSKRIRTTAQ